MVGVAAVVALLVAAPSARAQEREAGTSPATDVVESPVPPPEALLDYRDRRLVRTNLQYSTGGAYVPPTYNPSGGFQAPGIWIPPTTVTTWGVTDGRQAHLTAESFARLTGDDAVLARMDMGRKRARNGAIIAGLAAVGLAADAAYYAHFTAIAPTAAPQWDVAYTGSLVAGSAAAGAVTTAVMLPLIHAKKKKFVHRYYTPDAADARIRQYNETLRDELGLSAQHVLDIELGR